MADRVRERRQAYAAEITRSAHVSAPRIEVAFAAVLREDFVGSPPWRGGSGGLFGLTSTDDPARLYFRRESVEAPAAARICEKDRALF